MFFAINRSRLWGHGTAPLPIKQRLCKATPPRRDTYAVLFGNSELEAFMLEELLSAVMAGLTCHFAGVIRNTNRAVCARLAQKVALHYGEEG